MSPLDRTVLRSLESDLGDREVVCEIVRTYLDLLPGRERAVADAATTGDLVQLRREAHKLGSASAAVGAVELRRLCRELEAGRAPGAPRSPGEGAEPGSWTQVWASCCAEATAALTAWLAES